MSRDLRFARVIDALPEEVFDAFTRPAGQQAFHGTDDPGWIVESECDFRIGGEWTISFGPSPSELYRHRHVFRAINHAQRLLFDTTETRLDGSSFEFETEFTFEPRDDKTLMTMIQRGFPTSDLRDEHDIGLPNAFARLIDLIQGHKWLRPNRS
jgi:uncharacterized protein YndB with AHSA1/START domain